MELRRELEKVHDLQVVWVMADAQINEKSLRYIDGLGLSERITFARDSQSAAIDRLGLRKQDAEPIEAGVPHPTTYLLDRSGLVRFVDARTDYHIWLDPVVILEALAAL